MVWRWSRAGEWEREGGAIRRLLVFEWTRTSCEDAGAMAFWPITDPGNAGALRCGAKLLDKHLALWTTD